eukprot:1274534-Rhodomonas_salina.1
MWLCTRAQISTAPSSVPRPDQYRAQFSTAHVRAHTLTHNTTQQHHNTQTQKLQQHIQQQQQQQQQQQHYTNKNQTDLSSVGVAADADRVIRYGGHVVRLRLPCPRPRPLPLTWAAKRGRGRGVVRGLLAVRGTGGVARRRRGAHVGVRSHRRRLAGHDRLPPPCAPAPHNPVLCVSTNCAVHCVSTARRRAPYKYGPSTSTRP